MEPKKIKKLTIRKEAISTLSSNEMSDQKGGSTDTWCMSENICFPESRFDMTCQAWLGTCDSCIEVGCGGLHTDFTGYLFCSK